MKQMKVLTALLVVLIRDCTSFYISKGGYGRRYFLYKVSPPVKTSTELGPNYPASKSNIHPAPKFRFSQQSVDQIKTYRKPNWVEVSNKVEGNEKKNQKKIDISPSKSPPMTPVTDVPPSTPPPMTPLAATMASGTSSFEPIYPASKSNIHPAPKFRFNQQSIEQIKTFTKPNRAEGSNNVKGNMKKNQTKMDVSPSTTPPLTPIADVPPPPPPLMTPVPTKIGRRRFRSNYPASKSNIHPAPKFRFSQQNIDQIISYRKPNWLGISNRVEGNKKKNEKKIDVSPNKSPPKTPIFDIPTSTPSQMTPIADLSPSTLPPKTPIDDLPLSENPPMTPIETTVGGEGLIPEVHPPSESVMSHMREKTRRPSLLRRAYTGVKSIFFFLRK